MLQDSNAPSDLVTNAPSEASLDKDPVCLICGVRAIKKECVFPILAKAIFPKT